MRDPFRLKEGVLFIRNAHVADKVKEALVAYDRVNDRQLIVAILVYSDPEVEKVHPHNNILAFTLDGHRAWTIAEPRLPRRKLNDEDVYTGIDLTADGVLKAWTYFGSVWRVNLDDGSVQYIDWVK